MELAEWQEMCLVLPWQCDQMNRCKGFQGTCGCRWSRLCVPHQTGTKVSVSRPAWRRSVPCQCWLQPTPHNHCSSWTASRSSAGNGRIIDLFDHNGRQRFRQGFMTLWPHVCIYPNSLQVSAGPAVVHSHRAVVTPRDDVPVIGSEAHHNVSMITETLYKWLSSCRQQKNMTLNITNNFTSYFIHMMGTHSLLVWPQPLCISSLKSSQSILPTSDRFFLIGFKILADSINNQFSLWIKKQEIAEQEMIPGRRGYCEL